MNVWEKNKNLRFSASMMCADYGHLEDEIKALENAGIGFFSY